MPELAKLIEVNGAPGAYTITIDGTELPCYVLDGVTATAKRGEMSALTISIPADKIAFSDRKPEGDDEWTGDDRCDDCPSNRCDGCPTEPKAQGVKVGTAYIEVRPHFTGFDGDEFEQAVERAVARITPFKGAFSHGAGRAFRQ